MADPLPLDGIRVLDLTRARAGPTAVRQLADWGADAVMIEPPVALDISDTMSGPRHGPDYQNLHRNKRSMTLNLKEPEGIAILRRMVAEADVLVENYRPDVKHRLGIDYDSLAAVNPRLIYASISGFGQSGPYRDRPGFDQIAQGMGGLMSITGLPGQGPVRVGIPIDDLTAGLFTAIGILLALIERQRSGRGQWVHSSLLQAQIAMLDYQAARWLVSGEVPGQAGNNHPMAITTGLFQTADEPINVCADPQPIWERFCRAVEGEDLRADPRFASDDLRTQERRRRGRGHDGEAEAAQGPRLDRDPQSRRRARRARQPHRPGLRRPAGPASRHGAPGHPSHPGRYRSGGPAGDPDAHAQPHEPCRARARQCDGGAAPGLGLRR